MGETDDRAPKAVRHRWAWLLAHIFSADLERCPVCNGTMRWAEVAKTESTARRLMAKLGLAPHLSIAADADGDGLPDVLVSSGYYRDGVGKIYAFPYCSFME